MDLAAAGIAVSKRRCKVVGIDADYLNQVMGHLDVTIDDCNDEG